MRERKFWLVVVDATAEPAASLCLALLCEAFCPISLNLSANLSWSVTGCGLFEPTWEVVTLGHTETKKVRKIWCIYEEEKMVHGKLLLGRKTILILSEHSLKRVRLHLIQANSPLLLTRGDSASGFGCF